MAYQTEKRYRVAAMASRRRNARIAVLQTLFETGFPGRKHIRDHREVLERNIAEAGEQQVDATMAFKLLEGISEHESELRAIIQEHAPQWPLERMDSIARGLLLIGTFELLHESEVPPPVVMNEAIDIAKDFGEQETGKFVNGVLNSIAHNERET